VTCEQIKGRSRGEQFTFRWRFGYGPRHSSRLSNGEHELFSLNFELYEGSTAPLTLNQAGTLTFVWCTEVRLSAEFDVVNAKCFPLNRHYKQEVPRLAQLANEIRFWQTASAGYHTF